MFYNHIFSCIVNTTCRRGIDFAILEISNFNNRMTKSQRNSNDISIT